MAELEATNIRMSEHRTQEPAISRAQFASEKLGIQLWPKLLLIYQLIDLGLGKLLIRSANGIGKSTLLASLIDFEMDTQEDVQIVCTGANATALHETLWRSAKRLAKYGHINTESFNKFQWDIGNRRAIAIAPSKVESGQGFHAARVCILIDEATGMEKEKIDALLSNATGGNSLSIFTYNPIKADAAVYELEQNATPIEELLDENGKLDVDAALLFAQGGKWLSLGISAFEHPNVIAGNEIIKGAVTRHFVETRLQMNSVECHRLTPDAILLPWDDKKAYMPTPEALARVCGQWSQSIAEGFISGSVVVNSWKVESTRGLRIAGCDVGGGGEDPSVWTHFDGNHQFPFESIKTGELGLVANAIHKYCTDHEIDVLGIDDTGVGHGVTDRLNDLKKSYKLIPINFASAPKNFPEIALRKPANARCEMYLLLEKAMRSLNIRITYDKELQRELCSQKIVGHAKSETIRLEDKNLIKKRIGRSPNKADATAIALYAGRLLQYYNRPLMY